MKSFSAFINKEISERARTGKLLILFGLFVLLGIMNPAVAKLTPWLLEMMSESLESGGMTITLSEVTALDSWVQFYKNIPMGLIAFILIESSCFTKEYERGTLELVLTKGLKRHTVLFSKSIVTLGLWSAAYWLCFLITYGYNAYFWDNSIAKSLGLSAVCYWCFGVMVIALTVFFSVISKTGTAVLGGVGAFVVICYLVSIVPEASKYLPTYLADTNGLIYGRESAQSYYFSLVLSLIISVSCFAVSIPLFNKKRI